MNCSLPKPTLYALILLAAVLPWLVQPSAYWRDGPEFIVSATFLDISHPPGSPTYAQLINPLTWLPIGPIAARVNLGSALIATVLTFQVAILAICLGAPSLLSASFSLILFFLPGVMHQALTAEVYALASGFILAMITQLVLFERNGDKRHILSVALLAGIGSGAHVIVVIVAIFLSAITFALYYKNIWKLSFAVLCVGTLGLSVWGYLPARATQNPPFNTGGPHSVERFIRQVSDARDRELRAKSGLESFHLSTEQLAVDATRIANFCGVPFLILAGFGAMMLFLRRPLAGLTISGSLLLVAALFAGWDFAPFTIVSSELAVLAVYGLGTILEPNRPMLLRLTAIPIAIVVSMSNSLSSIELASELSTYDLPATASLQSFKNVAQHSTILIEPSYFYVTYLQSIENVRPDVTVFYQPALAFPDYFAPQINPANHSTYTSLANFLNSQSAGVAIQFEPTLLSNRELLKIARCGENGNWTVERPLTASISLNCASGLLNAVEYRTSFSPELQADEQYNRELLTLGSVELLRDLGELQQAKALSIRLCKRFSCSEKGLFAADYMQKLSL